MRAQNKSRPFFKLVLRSTSILCFRKYKGSAVGGETRMAACVPCYRKIVQVACTSTAEAVALAMAMAIVKLMRICIYIVLVHLYMSNLHLCMQNRMKTQQQYTEYINNILTC